MTPRQAEQRIEQNATASDATWYDYDAQAWYVGDTMQPCGHGADYRPPCAACSVPKDHGWIEMAQSHELADGAYRLCFPGGQRYALSIADGLRAQKAGTPFRAVKRS